MNLARASEKIASLTDELARSIDAKMEIDAIESPVDRIFNDVLRNRNRSPDRRHYSRDTLIWARQVYDASPIARTVVRKMLPLSSERILRSKFSAIRSAVSDSFLDIVQVDVPIKLWRKVNPEIESKCRVVLAVEAAAFRPTITIREDGIIEELDNFREFDPSLFETFLRQPQAFVSFLQEHWDAADSAFFIFQLQPLHSNLHCGIVYIVPATQGKGTEVIVARLFQLKALSEKRFDLIVCGLAFDGDSCYNSIHDIFFRSWSLHVNDRLLLFPDMLIDSVIISDPLHLLKRICYRLIRTTLLMGLEHEELLFSIKRFQPIGFLSPIVFLQSRVSKMHDSLPLELFSPETLTVILRDHLQTEFMLAPWCLLTAALTLSTISTRTPVDLLEIGFWFLYYYWGLRLHFGDPLGVIEKITIGRRASIYRAQQIRDALNTFVSFVTILRNSDRLLCLDRVRTNPLEHMFGKARMCCRDVNTMKRPIGVFTSDALTHAIDSGLDVSIVARHHVSVGVDCPPYSRIERSIFDSGTKQIARSSFTQTGIDLTRPDFGLIQMSELEPQPWQELYRIPEFVAQSPATGEGDLANVARVTKPRTLTSDRIFMGSLLRPDLSI
jgi:hypothetical protein